MDEKYIVMVNSFIDYANYEYHIVHALCSLEDAHKVWLKWEDVIACLRLDNPEKYWNMVTAINMDQFPNVVWPLNWKDLTQVVAISDLKKAFADQYPDFVAWIEYTYGAKDDAITNRIEKQIQAIDNKLTSIIAPMKPTARYVLHVHRLGRGHYKFTRGRPNTVHRQLAKLEKKFPDATRFFNKYPVLNAESLVEKVVYRLWESGYMASSRYNEIFFVAKNQNEDAITFDIINELVRD